MNEERYNYNDPQSAFLGQQLPWPRKPGGKSKGGKSPTRSGQAKSTFKGKSPKSGKSKKFY